MIRYSEGFSHAWKRYRDIEIPQRVLSVILGNQSENPEVMEYARVYNPSVSLDDIVIKPDIKKSLIALVKGYSEFSKIKKRMGFNQGFNNKNGYLIMLEGAAGTGKTLLAEGLTKYLGKKIMNIDASSFVNRSMTNNRIFSSAFDELLLEANMMML